MDGLLIIDKPVGPTSHDIVARVRRALGEPRIGHTGTLDPAASGVLPLVLGKATRLARFLSADRKSYDAVIRLGYATDTGDAQGIAVGAEYAGALPARDAIDAALVPFRGRFLQKPPVYSAKKIDGHRSYKLARAAARHARQAAPGDSSPGPDTLQPATLTPQPAPVEVTAYSLAIVSVENGRVCLQVECSAGFYVRSLAHDLGEQLGTGAHLVELRRTRSGDCALSEAIPLDVIEQNRSAAVAGLVPLAAMLPGLPFVVLTPDGITRVRHGRELGPHDLVAGARSAGAVAPIDAAATGETDRWIRLLTPDGALLALARDAPGSGLLHPSVVLI
jgi:tRNA pseudouridine55 synthase